MPTYDFLCLTCEHRTTRVFSTYVGMLADEALWSQGDSTLECPDCGDQLVRQPSAPNFTIHGFNAKNGYSK